MKYKQRLIFLFISTFILFSLLIRTNSSQNELRSDSETYDTSVSKGMNVRNHTNTTHTEGMKNINHLNELLKSDIENIPHQFLTLMTTMRDLGYRKQIHLNTIKNWAHFSPWIVPVLFVKNLAEEFRNTSSWGHIATQYRWKVLEYSHTHIDIPVMKTMFSDVMKLNINSTYIGYANADMLFEKNLLRTLLELTNTLKDIRKKTIFVSGQRVNINEQVLNIVPSGEHPNYVGLLGADRQPFWPGSADYFIFSQVAGFYWDKVPDFVVGREGYDSFLISAAVQWNATYLDATETILAVHQTGPDGNHAGETTHDNRRVNYDMIPKDFNLSPGYHYCAPWHSVFQRTEGEFWEKTLQINILPRDYNRVVHSNRNCKHKINLD